VIEGRLDQRLAVWEVGIQSDSSNTSGRGHVRHAGVAVAAEGADRGLDDRGDIPLGISPSRSFRLSSSRAYHVINPNITV
jgi:hypothetical protein